MMYLYATVMDCLRSVKSLHDFDLCQKFGVRAEMLQEINNPWCFIGCLVGKCESRALYWPEMIPRRRMQFHTAFVVYEGEKLVMDCAANSKDLTPSAILAGLTNGKPL